MLDLRGCLQPAFDSFYALNSNNLTAKEEYIEHVNNDAKTLFDNFHSPVIDPWGVLLKPFSGLSLFSIVQRRNCILYVILKLYGERLLLMVWLPLQNSRL